MPRPTYYMNRYLSPSEYYSKFTKMFSVIEGKGFYAPTFFDKILPTLNVMSQKCPADGQDSKFTKEKYNRLYDMFYQLRNVCIHASSPEKYYRNYFYYLDENGKEIECREDYPGAKIEKIPEYYYDLRKLDEDYGAGNYLTEEIGALLEEGKKFCSLSHDEYKGIVAATDFCRYLRETYIPDPIYTGELSLKETNEKFKKYSDIEVYAPGKSIWLKNVKDIFAVDDCFRASYRKLFPNKNEYYDFIDQLAYPDIKQEGKRIFPTLYDNIGRGMALKDSKMQVVEGNYHKIIFFYENIGPLLDAANNGKVVSFNSKLSEIINTYDYTNFAEEIKKYLDYTSVRFMYSEQEYKLLLSSAIHFEKLINSRSKEEALVHFKSNGKNIREEVDAAYKSFEEKTAPMNAEVDFFMTLYERHNSVVRKFRESSGDKQAGAFYHLDAEGAELSDGVMRHEWIITHVREDKAELLLDNYLECLDHNKALAEELEKNIPSPSDYGITDQAILETYEKIKEKFAEAKRALTEEKPEVKENHVEEQQPEEQIKEEPAKEVNEAPEIKENIEAEKEEKIEEKKAQPEEEPAQEVNEDPKIKENIEAEKEEKTEEKKAQPEEEPAQEVNEAPEIKENIEAEKEEKTEEPIQEKAPEIKENIVAEQPVQPKPGVHLDKISQKINLSIKQLEAAKTTVNSSQYKELIQCLKGFKDLPGNDTRKLQILGAKIDNYINHKAADGVKANTYKKLAAVHMANMWVSEALHELGITRNANYKDVYNAYAGKDKKDLPKPGDVDYDQVLAKMKAENSQINKLTAFAADNCLCNIMLKADPNKRSALKEMRNIFNMVKTNEVQKQGSAL